jgi:hypothetical protein
MATTTRYHYLGDKMKAASYRGAGQATLAKLRDHNKFNDLKDNALNIQFKDGTQITAAAGFFGQEDVYITCPEAVAKKAVAAVEQEGELQRFIVIFAMGHSMYVIPDSPTNWYEPGIVLPWQAIVYDMQTKTYAKIPDPVPADADEDGNIIFPCASSKVVSWWSDAEWISKQKMGRNLVEQEDGSMVQERVTSEPWKVWGETFVFYETMGGRSYVYGPNASVNAEAADCSCNSYPEKYGINACFDRYTWHDSTGLYFCPDGPKSDTGYCDYKYLQDPFFSIHGVPILSAYSCYEGGYCNYIGGPGLAWKTTGEHVGILGRDIMIYITPTTIFGSEVYDYNKLGYGNFGAALLTCSYNAELTSSYFHQRNYNKNVFDSVDSGRVYWIDYGQHKWQGAAQVHLYFVRDHWNAPGNYEVTVGNTLHTPIGAIVSTDEGEERNHTDSGAWQQAGWNNFPPYTDYEPSGDSDVRQYAAYEYEHFIPKMEIGDLNAVNCYRRYYSLTTKSQEVLFQFYLWHYMIVHFTTNKSGRSGHDAATTQTVTHTWGHTLLSQAEFTNKVLPNPLNSADYTKYDDIVKDGGAVADFTFNTPELETCINALIAKIYGDYNTQAKIDAGEATPLIFEFEPYIVETGVSGNYGVEGDECKVCGDGSCAVCAAGD